MRSAIIAITLGLLLGLSAGCVGKTVNGLTAAEISAQAAGVAAALENLPKAPDAAVQSQVEGYAAWAAFLAKTVSVIAGAGS